MGQSQNKGNRYDQYNQQKQNKNEVNSGSQTPSGNNQTSENKTSKTLSSINNGVNAILKKIESQSLETSLTQINGYLFAITAGLYGSSAVNNIKANPENFYTKLSQHNRKNTAFDPIIDAIKKIAPNNKSSNKSTSTKSAVQGGRPEGAMGNNTTGGVYTITINGLSDENINSLVNLINVATTNPKNGAFDKVNDGISKMMNNIKSIVDTIEKAPTMDDKKTVQKIENISRIVGAVYNANESIYKSKKPVNLDFFSTGIDELIQQYKNIIENLKGIDSKDITDAQNNIKNISKILSAISGIHGSINEQSYDSLTNFLRKIIKLTERPTALTKTGLSNRGLIWQIINNIQNAVEDIKSTNTQKNIHDISGTLNEIINIGMRMDKKSMQEMQYNIKLLQNITNSKNLGTIISNIGEIRLPRNINNKLETIIGIFNGLNNLTYYISTKNTVEIFIKGKLAKMAVKSIHSLFNAIDETAVGIKDTEKNLKAIVKTLNGIELVKIETLKHISNVVKECLVISTYLMMLGMVKKNAKKGLDALKSILTNISQTLSDISNNITIDDNIEKNITKIRNVIVALGGISLALSVIAITAPLAYVGGFLLGLTIKALATAINKINDIDISKDIEKKVQSVAALVMTCGMILLLAAVVGNYITMNITGLIGFTVALTLFVAGVIKAYSWATKDGLKDTQAAAEGFAKLVGISALIMLIGGGIMTMYPQLIIGTLLFTVSLTLFIVGVIKAYSWATKDGLKDTKESAEGFAILIGISAMTMLIGGAFFTYHPELILGAFGFVLALTAFIYGTVWAYTSASKNLTDAKDSMMDFTILIGMSAAIMMIGGALLINDPTLIIGVTIFVIALTAFIYGTVWAYTSASEKLKDAKDSLIDFTILIGMSAAIMLIGGTLLINDPTLIIGIIGFTIALFSFIWGVTWAYTVNAEKIGENMKHAIGFAILVGISAATMMIGATMILKNGWSFVGAVLGFAATLLGFILIIMGAYLIAGYLLKKLESQGIKGVAISGLGSQFAGMDKNGGLGLVMAICAIVVLSSIMILIGGMLFLKNPGLAESALYFAAITGGMVLALASIIFVVGKFLKPLQVAMGLLVMTGIVVVLYCFIDMMNIINDISQRLEKNKLDTTISAMWKIMWFGMTVVAIFAGLMALGAAFGSGGGSMGAAIGAGSVAAVIAAAELFAYGIVKIIGAFADVALQIAISGDAIAKMQVPDTDKIKQLIGVYYELAKSLVPFANPIISIPLGIAMGTIFAMTRMIYTLGFAIQEFASLHVPLFDNNGKLIGKRSLTKNDFKNAADNIKEIVTTIGGAIIDLYKDDATKNKDNRLFPSGPIESLAALLGFDTPFTRVCKSCMILGEMISKIAEGVKEYADLRIKTYDKNGNVIGTRELSFMDFIKAGFNVGLIITTLGGAIIDLYEKDKSAQHSMFHDKWWVPGSDSPFAKVIESSTKMGNMISTIGEAVKDFANLRINKYDENGKVIGTEKMDQTHFKDASEHVSAILTTIGAAVQTVYAQNSKMFDNAHDCFPSLMKTITGFDIQDLFNGVKDLVGDNPFIRVVKGLTSAAALVHVGATAIDAVLNLGDRFNKSKKKYVADKIELIFSTILDPIKEFLDGNNGKTFEILFRNTDNSLFKFFSGTSLAKASTPLEQMELGFKSIAKMLNTVVTTVEELSPRFNAITGDAEQLKKNISAVMDGLVSGIFTVMFAVNEGETTSKYNTFTKGVDSGGVWGKISDWFLGKDSQFNVVSTIYDSIIKLIQKVIPSLKDIDKLSTHTDNTTNEIVLTSAAFIEKIFGSMATGIDKIIEQYYDKKGNAKYDLTDITEKLESIGSVFKTQKAVISTIIEIYSSLDTFLDPIIGRLYKKNEDGTLNIDSKMTSLTTYIGSMGVSLKTMIDKVGESLNSIATQGNFDAMVKVGMVKDNINNVVSSIKEVVGLYQSVTEFMNGSVDTAKIDNLSKQMTAMVKGIWATMQAFVNPAYDEAEENANILTEIKSYIPTNKENNQTITKMTGFNNLLDAFVLSMENYKMAMMNISTAFSYIPNDSSKIGIIDDIIGRVNTQVKNTPDLTKFEKETILIERYVNTVNKVNVKNIDRLTTLANALTQMSTKLGSLDKVTDILANKVTATLNVLSTRLEESAHTIRHAETLQEERHKKIDDALTKIRGLMAMPLEINVTHKPDTGGNPLSPGAGSGDQIPTPGADGGDGTDFTTHTGDSVPSSSSFEIKSTSQQDKQDNKKIPQTAKEVINKIKNGKSKVTARKDIKERSVFTVPGNVFLSGFQGTKYW